MLINLLMLYARTFDNPPLLVSAAAVLRMRSALEPNDRTHAMNLGQVSICPCQGSPRSKGRRGGGGGLAALNARPKTCAHYLASQHCKLATFCATCILRSFLCLWSVN